jgi:hypothetical protein
VVIYHLLEEPKGEVTLSFQDPGGEVIRAFSTGGAEGQDLSAKKGMNRFVWDMRYPGATEAREEATHEGPDLTSAPGPLAPPGRYGVELKVGEHTLAETFEVLKDPRSSASQEDLDEQFALLVRIRDKLSDVEDAVSHMRSIRGQVEEWEQRAGEGENRSTLSATAASLKEKLSNIENELTLADPPRSPRGSPSRLDTKLAHLTGEVASADWVPTKNAKAVFDEVGTRVDEQLGRLNHVIEVNLPTFVKLVGELKIPAILP